MCQNLSHFIVFLKKGVLNCSTVVQYTFSVSLMSCTICKIGAKNEYISFRVTSGSGDHLLFSESRYWWQYLLVSTTSSWIISRKKSLKMLRGVKSLFIVGATL